MQLTCIIYHSILVLFKENSIVGEPLPAEMINLNFDKKQVWISHKLIIST